MVFEIAAVLPLLLQLSLSLFFIGLCYFTAAVHSSIGYTTLPLVIAWALCFMVAAILPLLYPLCPYRVTLLKVAISRVHRGCVNIAQQARLHLLRSRQSPLHDDPAKELTEQDSLQTDQGTSAGQDLLRVDQSKDEHIKSVPLWRPTKIVHSILWPAVDLLTTSDEDEVVQRADHDLSILAAADAVQSNDEHLSTSIVEAVKQIERKSYSGEQFLAFFHRVLANRLVIPAYQGPDHEHTYRLCIDLRTTSLPSRSREAVLDIVYSYLRLTYQENRSLNPRDDFSPSDAILIVLSLTSGRSIYDIPYLLAILGQDKSLPTLAQACRGILLASPDDAHSQTLLINAVEGILRLRRGLEANWTAISFLYQIFTLDRNPHSYSFHPLDRISSTFETSGHQFTADQLEYTGSAFFRVIDEWTESRVIAPSSIAKLLRAELEWACENRIQPREHSKTNVEGFKSLLGHSVHHATLAFAISFLCIHFAAARHSWWNCWSWINPAQLKHSEASARIMLIVLCHCISARHILASPASKDYHVMSTAEKDVMMSLECRRTVYKVPDIGGKSRSHSFKMT